MTTSNTPLGMLGPIGGAQPTTAPNMMGPISIQPQKSLWDSFLYKLSGNWRDDTSQSQLPASTDARAKEQQMQQAAQQKIDSLASGVLPAKYNTRDNFATKGLNTLTHVTGDILLNVAKTANDWIVKPLITTPISAGAIVTDPNSPLYKKGPNGATSPLDAMTKAVKRADKVSPFQAIASNSLFQNTPPGLIAQGMSNVFNGPDFSKVNVFSDKSIKENYSDNIFGKIYTGTGDVVTSFYAFGGAGKVATGIGDMFRVASGMPAKNAPLVDVLAHAKTTGSVGIEHVLSNGAYGTKTNFGDDLVKMAEETSPTKVAEKFQHYSNNPQLVDFVAREKDPHKILDLILADNGDVNAQMRALEHTRLATYAAMGGKDGVVSKIVTSGGAWLPEGSTLNALKDVHIDSIKWIPEHERLWNLFNDSKTDLQQVFGKGWFPKEGPVANAAYGAGAWVERTLGGHNNAVTRIVSLAGSRMPTWSISFSNSNPWQAMTEIESAFKSLKMFRNPDNMIKIGPNKAITAKEYIENVKNAYLSSTSDMEKFSKMEDVGKNIGLHMAMTKGIYQEGETEQLISNLISRYKKHNESFVQTGYGMSLQGDAIATDINTQSQIASAVHWFPWDKIEKELDYHTSGYIGKSILNTQELARDLFRKISEYTSLDLIGSPKYIARMSLGEPTLGAWIALGPNFLRENLVPGVGNFFKNNLNRISETATRMQQFSSGERRAITNKIAALGQEWHDALYAHNLLQDEFEAMFVRKTRTGKTVELYGPEVKKAYRESAQLVKQAEEEYRLATRQFGDTPDIPSPASLQRRINFLEKNAGPINKGNLTAIQQAKMALRKAQENRSIFASASEVDSADRAIAESFQKLDDIIKRLGVAQGERAEIFGKTLKNKQRYHGPGDSYRIVADKWVRMPEVYDANAVGEALKAETGNVVTSAITYGNELTASTRAGILRRHTPTTVTDVNDPLYYDELAQLMNREYRQDVFVQRILAGDSPEQLLAWAKTKQGVRYMDGMGVPDEASVINHVYDKYATVHRYLPSESARQLLLKKEVLAPELEKELHSHVGELVPIHPRDFNYLQVNSGLGVNFASSLSSGIDRIGTSVFTTLLKPESPIRHSFIRQLAMDISAKKANLLAAQGKSITFEQLEALKQASFVQAFEESRKVFYTVTNPNRLIYASRYITLFPTATFNAFYRYARLAVKYTINTLGFMHAYNSMFQSFGIDKNGNPVKDVRDTQYIVVPMTDDLGMFNGKGIRLSARSIGFMLNAPSITPYAALPISHIVQSMPSADVTLKTLLGPMYDTVFPMGTTKTDFLTTMVPAWLRDSVKWTRGATARAAYANSVQSIYDYHQVKVSMGIEKKMPTLEQVEKEASKLYMMKAWFEFIFMPTKIDTTPMSTYQSLYYSLESKYRAEGKDSITASKLAGQEFLATVGSDFPVDQITFTGSPARANIAKTQEGYARVYKDNVDLTRELVHLDPKDPFLVGLLTQDIDVTNANRSAVISQKLSQPNATLPDIGGVVPLNDMKLSPEQIQVQRENQRMWDKFFTAKKELDNIAIQYKNSRGVPYKSMDSIPSFQQALKKYAINVLGKENPTWLNSDYLPKGKIDKGTRYAQGLTLIVNNKKFMDAHGSTPFWRSAKEFIDFRNELVKLSQATDDPKWKTAYRKAFVANLFGDETVNPPIEGRIGTYDPKLQRILTMYFQNDNLEKVG